MEFLHAARGRATGVPLLHHQRILCSADNNLLYCKAATVITNVLLAIASNLHAATVVPRAPGQRRNCSFWLLPNLCGEKSMKSNILPLGFSFHPPPDPSKRFDSPMCSESSDLPWKLFEGCWHSFHISCLNGKNLFVICRDCLEKNICLASPCYCSLIL